MHKYLSQFFDKYCTLYLLYKFPKTLIKKLIKMFHQHNEETENNFKDFIEKYDYLYMLQKKAKNRLSYYCEYCFLLKKLC